jgi:uncharacterized membrane protein YuzA (DUF378 family)
MQTHVCLPERFSKLLLAVILLIGGFGFGIIGITVLPVIGLIFAVPMLVLAGYFYRVHLNERCRIEEGR